MNVDVKKTLKGLLILAVLLVGGICAIAATKPDEYHYTRTATMQAAPAKIFAQVNNLQNWNAWSPWVKLDPDAMTTYEGPQSGKGASMKWDGNKKMGQGTLTITESQPSKLVQYKLDFVKPMAGSAMSEFTFEPQEGGQTLVSWSMYGTSTYVEKVISVAMNCERMIGKQFDEGLASLKGIVEAK